MQKPLPYRARITRGKHSNLSVLNWEADSLNLGDRAFMAKSV